MTVGTSALKLCEMMPHHRPVRFCRDRQLTELDKITSVTPFIYSPLHLSPAKNDNTCAEHGYITCTLLLFLFLLETVITTTTTVLWPFVRDYLGEPLPEGLTILNFAEKQR